MDNQDKLSDKLIGQLRTLDALDKLGKLPACLGMRRAVYENISRAIKAESMHRVAEAEIESINAQVDLESCNKAREAAGEKPIEAPAPARGEVDQGDRDGIDPEDVLNGPDAPEPMCRDSVM